MEGKHTYTALIPKILQGYILIILADSEEIKILQGSRESPWLNYLSPL